MPRVERRDHGRQAVERRRAPAPASRASRARRRSDRSARKAGSARTKRRRQPPRLDRLAQRQRRAPQRPRATAPRRRERQLVAARSPPAARPSWSGWRSATHGHVVRVRASRAHSCREDQARSVQRCPRRLGRAEEDAHRGHVGSMCGLRDPIPAVVISPLLPEPPVTGGQKRTLRLLEAMSAPGLHPRILTPDAGERGASSACAMRGWAVEIVPEPPRACSTASASTPSAARARSCGGLAVRFEELAEDAALVQFEHTQSAYYARAGDRPTVLSLHNLDSAAAAAPPQHLKGVAWLRERNRAAELRPSSAARSRGSTASCASPSTTPRSRTHSAGAPMLAPNGVDDEFFAVDGPGRRGSRAVLRALRLRGQPARRSSASSPRAGRAVRAARPNARLAIAGGGIDDALRARFTREGVDVLGLVADLPAVHRRRARGDRADLGGRRHAAEGARGARRRARAWSPRRWARPGIGFEHERHGLLAETPGDAGDRTGGCAGPTRRAHRVERAGFWPNITAGKRRFPARPRSTRK